MKCNGSITRTVLFFTFQILISTSIYSQTKKDTIYFDENWSICEKPVAEYYRIAALKANETIFYIDSVSDYYIDGTLEMKGYYDNKGIRNGHFSFFRKNGKKLKEGIFERNEMRGLWNYFNEKGNLIAQLNCKNSTNFVPLLLINNQGDTLLKNGNGKFIFSCRKDFPSVFSADYSVQGEVINGKKEGNFNYWIGEVSEKRTAGYSETFKKDEFKTGRQISSGSPNIVLDKPLNFLNLEKESKLDRIDNFDHSNMVFGYGENALKKLINYLGFGTIPEINSESKNYSENIIDFYNIIGTVMRKSLKPLSFTNLTWSFPPSGKSCNILSFSIPKSLATIIPREVHFNATFTLDTSGYVSNSVFKGNIKQDEINRINYYLSRLSGLVPFQKNNQKLETDLHINFVFVNEGGYYKYLAFNADSLAESDFIQQEKFPKAPSIVDSLPKYPGGTEAWNHFLERNLNSNILVDHNAPNGIYSVKVGFLVNIDGTVSNIETDNNPGFGTMEEAIRIIQKMKKWFPAIKDGKPVPFKMTQSISFTLSGQ